MAIFVGVMEVIVGLKLRNRAAGGTGALRLQRELAGRYRAQRFSTRRRPLGVADAALIGR